MSEKSLQTPSLAPIFGVLTSDADLAPLSRQRKESDLVAGRWSSLGKSDCLREHSAYFRISKRVSAFTTRSCIAANLFEADIASLGLNIVLLAVPWPHVLSLVSGCLSAQPIEGATCASL